MTNREQELTTALACHVRLFAFEQIARTWWPNTPNARRNARRRLTDLCDKNLLTRLDVQARPLLALCSPVTAWCPGLPPPNFSSLAWTLWKRWQVPPRHTTVYVASTHLVNRLGGVATGKLHNLAAVSHDLHVAEVYLYLLRHAPDLARQWVGEDVLAPTRTGQKLPDAVLHNSSGKPQLVIEFGGAYPPERLQAFHEDCKQRNLPYEIW